MKKLGLNKKGAMELSFGMIFSIILIIAFLAFTIYAINKFLEIQKELQAATMVKDLQGYIDKMWRGGQGSQQYIFGLPSKTQAVCLVDFTSQKSGPKEDLYNELSRTFFEKENFVFYPVGSAEGLDSVAMEHINITKITKSENPYCFTAVKSKIKIVVKMTPGDSLVTLERGI